MNAAPHPTGPQTPLPAPHAEMQRDGYGEHLNKLRAGVLGANDGIISVAATLVGVAGATADKGALGMVALASVSAGALSMALGEYVSVSSQADSQRALVDKETRELEEMPEQELEELTGLMMEKGISEPTARQAAIEMTQRDALGAHLEVELGIDPDDIPSPINAAISSGLAFTVGALLPTAAMLLAPHAIAVPVTFAVVALVLAVTGGLGAHLGGAPGKFKAAARLVVGGALALAATFAIGSVFGTGAVG